ncbi:MAG: FMN-binding glutamate synthase family protein, partial [Rhizobiaceae bacterium]
MENLKLAFSLRFLPLTLSVIMALVTLVEMFAAPSTVSLLILPFLVFVWLSWLGVHDMRQEKSS